jgi:4-alpha-glucanotransferase
MGVREYANERGIRIVGDVPIFVAHDSADVWSNPELFFLDDQGEPTVVAGVPPDYFSETGQRWGNPLYRWDVLKKSGFAWWIERFRAILHLVDVIRVDHFRGFEAYWEVPASESTAMNGKWVKAPGKKLFQAVESTLGELPIIAEDLGVITEEVTALRKAFDFPGMKVLQFAFGGEADNDYLPHNYEKDCVAYTGTHDNDTTLGWYHGLEDRVRDHVRRYLWSDGRQVNWDLIRLASMSAADLAIVPLQDVLSLGSEARLNFPGRPEGNWEWRYEAGALGPHLAHRLRELAETYGRLPRSEETSEKNS